MDAQRGPPLQCCARRVPVLASPGPAGEGGGDAAQRAPV